MNDINNPYGFEVIELDDVKYVDFNDVDLMLKKIEEKDMKDFLLTNEALNIKNDELRERNRTFLEQINDDVELKNAMLKENKRLKDTLKQNGIAYESYKVTVLRNDKPKPVILMYLTKQEANEYYKNNIDFIEEFSIEKLID